MFVRQAAPFVLLSIAVAIAVGGAARSRGAARPVALPAGARQYDAAERVARAAWLGAQARSEPTSLTVAHAADTLVRALIDNGHGWTADAAALAQRTVSDKEALKTADVDLARSLVGLGAVLAASADYEAALSVLRRAEQLTANREAAPADVRTDVLDHLGSVLGQAGRYQEALATLDRSLAIKSVNGSSATSLADTLEAETLAAQGAGLYSRSGATIRRAAVLRRTGSADDDPARVTTLTLMAQQLWFEGRFVESRLASENAVRLGALTLRPTHPRLTETIRYLAATYADLGDLERSRQRREQALTLAVSEFGERHLQTAAYLNSAAMGDLTGGDYVRARRRFGEVLATVESGLGPRHNYAATALLNLALVNAQLGDYEQAAQEHDRAISIWEGSLGPDHPFVAVALSELATVYQRQNRPSAARPLLERALAIRERQLGSSHPQTARTMVELAATLVQLDERGRAQDLAERALTTWRQRNAANAPEYADMLALHASIQHQAGDDEAAERSYRQALDILERAFGVASPEYVDAEAGLSRVLASLGKSAAARRSAVHVETAGRVHLQLLLRTLPERQAVSYAATRPRGLDVLLSLAVMGTATDSVRPAVDALIRSRALVLDGVAGRLQALNETETREQMAWRSAQQRLANLLVRGPGPMTTTQYGEAVLRARRDRDAAEETMAATDTAFRAQRSRDQLGIDDVIASLPPGAAIVSFARYSEEQPAQPNRPVRPQPVYAAFVIRHAGTAIALRIGAASVIDTQVDRWRAAIATTIGHSSSDLTAVNTTGQELRRLVWDVVAPSLGDARAVFIVPDGALALVPFAALPSASGGYLIEDGRVIHYLTAERDVVTPADAPLSRTGLLAVGGPAFDRLQAGVQRAPTTSDPSPTTLTAPASGTAPCGLQARTFRALPATLREIDDISTIWRESEASRATDPRVLTGAAASEAMFKEQASRYRILHLATHGFFVESGCADTSGALAIQGAATQFRGLGGLTRAPSDLSDDPLRLSGLAMAGANDLTTAQSADDGILTAEEVAALNLSGVEWAVLSACDTGLGTSRTGEGVFGLRRAFQTAGVRTVIMSLWSVDDGATRTWMRALYSARFLRHRSTSDAVYEASLSVLRNRRAAGLSTHPVFWASFAAVGDWR